MDIPFLYRVPSHESVTRAGVEERIFFLSSSSADTLRSFFLQLLFAAVSFAPTLARSSSLCLSFFLFHLCLLLSISLSPPFSLLSERVDIFPQISQIVCRGVFSRLAWMCDAFLNSIPNIPRRLWRAMTPRGENARRVVPVKARSRPRRARAPIERSVSSPHSPPRPALLSLDRSRSPTPDPFALTSGDFPAPSFHFSYSPAVLRISSSSFTFFAAALSICS